MIAGAFSSHLEEIFRQQAASSLSQTEEDIRRFFLNREYDLRQLANIAPPDQQQPSSTRIAMRGLLHNVESLFRLSAITVSGREWLRVNKFPTGRDEQKTRNLFGSKLYQRPMSELVPFLGNIKRSDDFPLPLVDMALPVKDRRSGQVCGILWAEISFQGIQTLLERYLPTRGKILLVRMENSEILLQADDTREDYTGLEADVLRQVIQTDNDQGSLEKSGVGRTATFFYRKFVVHELPFLLLYYQPNETIYFLADRLATNDPTYSP